MEELKRYRDLQEEQKEKEQMHNERAVRLAGWQEDIAVLLRDLYLTTRIDFTYAYNSTLFPCIRKMGIYGCTHCGGEYSSRKTLLVSGPYASSTATPGLWLMRVIR